MAKVGVVTDSTACIPKGLAKDLNICVIPLTYVFEDSVLIDDTNLDMNDFYRRLKDTEKLPTTSAASPGAYVEAFKTLAPQVEGIICITVASKFSAMFRIATIAKQIALNEIFDIEIHVMDSGSAAMAQGFVALAAARAAARGEPLNEVIRTADEIKARVKLLAVVDSLEYLARSGRLPKIAAWGASLIGLNPILSLQNGHVRPVTVVLGSKSGTVKMLKTLIKESKCKSNAHISVIHTNAQLEAVEFKEKIKDSMDYTELFVSKMTPVIGIYTGTGVLGLAYYFD